MRLRQRGRGFGAPLEIGQDQVVRVPDARATRRGPSRPAFRQVGRGAPGGQQARSCAMGVRVRLRKHDGGDGRRLEVRSDQVVRLPVRARAKRGQSRRSHWAPVRQARCAPAGGIAGDLRALGMRVRLREHLSGDLARLEAQWHLQLRLRSEEAASQGHRGGALRQTVRGEPGREERSRERGMAVPVRLRPRGGGVRARSEIWQSQ